MVSKNFSSSIDHTPLALIEQKWWFRLIKVGWILFLSILVLVTAALTQSILGPHTTIDMPSKIQCADGNLFELSDGGIDKLYGYEDIAWTREDVARANALCLSGNPGYRLPYNYYPIPTSAKEFIVTPTTYSTQGSESDVVKWFLIWTVTIAIVSFLIQLMFLYIVIGRSGINQWLMEWRKIWFSEASKDEK